MRAVKRIYRTLTDKPDTGQIWGRKTCPDQGPARTAQTPVRRLSQLDLSDRTRPIGKCAPQPPHSRCTWEGRVGSGAAGRTEGGGGCSCKTHAHWLMLTGSVSSPVVAYTRLMYRKSEPLSKLKRKHAVQQHLGRLSRIRGCRPCRKRRKMLLRRKRGARCRTKPTGSREKKTALISRSNLCCTHALQRAAVKNGHSDDLNAVK